MIYIPWRNYYRTFKRYKKSNVSIANIIVHSLLFNENRSTVANHARDLGEGNSKPLSTNIFINKQRK